MVEDTDSISDAFAALGDETRVAILEALVDARREAPENPGLSFSELRERVGVADSGRFNYHLGKLRERFVEETVDGYELTNAGCDIVGAILAGTYDTHVELEPEPVADTCPMCGTALVAEYADGGLSVDCENDHTVLSTPVPPASATNRSMSELVDFATRTVYSMFDLLAGGICTECYGRVDREIRAVPDGELVDYVYRTACERCGFVTTSAAAAAVLREPAFVSFCHDQGVDVDAHLPWTLPGMTDGGGVERVSADPPRYELRVERDDDALSMTLDGEGEVLDATRA
ncbi:ArsR/SmtB family transcription factor [Halorubellus salinus]|uniref:ArsR/SmtB family transcription factor n=1 Tax=Halorubellus salinus TaxID=755309 RepID=UPI001D08A430|nr:winged helix-turn-helix domain-containing protein [Halorubellus salinus]